MTTEEFSNKESVFLKVENASMQTGSHSRVGN